MSAPYYSDDAVTLYLGDCREVTDWLTADVLVTDPPYGVRMAHMKGSFRPDTGSRYQDTVPDAIAGDVSVESRDVILLLWDSRPAIVFGSWRAPRPTGTNHRLIWHKAGSFGVTNCAFILRDEEIYVLGSGFRKSSPPLGSVITTTEHRSQAVRAVGHPTPKPVHLMELLIDRCPPGVIADPFAGSGSTLIAAKRQGRQAIGVEIDERYCEIAAKRLAQDVLDFGESA